MQMNLKPFKPVYFKIPLDTAVSPPFDTISEEQEKDLLSRPVNIYHLTSPNSPDKARQQFDSWVREGVLSFAEKEVMIVLVQDFPGFGRAQSRIGVIGIVESSSERDDVLPHEKTFEHFVEERKRLMLQIESQVEPIFLVTESQSFDRELRQAIKGKIPYSTFEEPVGVVNHAYCIDQRETIEKISLSVSQGRAIVADGHHRLKATKDIFSSGNNKSDFWKYSFSYVTSYYNESLLISGIHRLVTGKTNGTAFMENLKRYFDVEMMNLPSQAGEIQIYDGDYYKLTPREAISGSPPELVDNVILRKCLGLSDSELEKEVSYAYNIAEAIEAVDSHGGIAILVPSWDKSEFLNFLKRGCLLPQKSTFFYPKVPSGLGIYSRRNEEIDLSSPRRLESPDRC